MAELMSSILPFPSNPDLLKQPSFATTDIEADADLRAAILGDLLDQIADNRVGHPDDLRLKVASHLARELLDELVTLYRRAVSNARSGNTHATTG
ncbi:hypothetical protein [Pseudomonas oryzihabitans]|uniref:hypothetical protein n=1 Tax=Pseudomonas oryzihabitans TaxID=47885 RepID=UPI0011A5338A|nr:hypothetical protein [Pseudomonas oryzihabitans]